MTIDPRILKQGQELGELFARATRLEARRDRRLSFLQDTVTFKQSTTSPQNAVFNVPASNAFRAQRLTVIPEVRRVDESSDALSEVTFRPTYWWWQANPGFSGGMLDCTFEKFYTSGNINNRPLQSAPFDSAQLFSGSALTGGNGPAVTTDPMNFFFESAPGLVFDPTFDMDPGSTLTLRITPRFTLPYSAIGEEVLVYEYRLTCILEGHKVMM